MKFSLIIKATTLTSSNTGRLHSIEILSLKTILSEQLHAREHSVDPVTSCDLQ